MAAIVQPETEPGPEAKTEAQKYPQVVVMSLEGPVPTLGGRAQAAYRRAHDQLRAFGLDPDRVLGSQTPAGGPPTTEALVGFLREPEIDQLSRPRQLEAAQRRFGPVTEYRLRKAYKIVGTRGLGRHSCA